MTERPEYTWTHIYLFQNTCICSCICIGCVYILYTVGVMSSIPWTVCSVYCGKVFRSSTLNLAWLAFMESYLILQETKQTTRNILPSLPLTPQFLQNFSALGSKAWITVCPVPLDILGLISCYYAWLQLYRKMADVTWMSLARAI